MARIHARLSEVPTVVQLTVKKVEFCDFEDVAGVASDREEFSNANHAT